MATFDDFMKLDIRVGMIIEAKKFRCHQGRFCLTTRVSEDFDEENA